AVDEHVRVVVRHADHGQHFAVARIEGDRRAGPSGEYILGDLLQACVDRQVQVAAGGRRLALYRAQNALVGVYLNLLVAGPAVQLRLVALLDAGLADVRRARIQVGIEPARLVDVDAADVADDVRELGAERVRASQVRHDVDAGEAPALD